MFSLVAVWRILYLVFGSLWCNISLGFFRILLFSCFPLADDSNEAWASPKKAGPTGTPPQTAEACEK